jgi:hypothetical protein
MHTTSPQYLRTAGRHNHNFKVYALPGILAAAAASTITIRTPKTTTEDEIHSLSTHFRMIH